MKQLLSLIDWELRLYLKSKTVWLLGILAVLNIILPSVSILLLEYLIINGITYAQRSGFSTILASLPYHTGRLLVGRFIALLLLLMGLWPLMLLATGLFPERGTVEWLSNANQLTWLTLKYIITCMTAIGFVFFISVMTQNPWKLYLIITICWMLGLGFASNIVYFPTWSKIFLFENGIMAPRSPSVAVGYILEQDLLPSLAIFQVTIAILLFKVKVYWQLVIRGESFEKSKIFLTLTFVAILTALFSGFTAWQAFAHRESGYNSAFYEMERTKVAGDQSGLQTTLVMEEYDLELKLRTADHYLEGRARIKNRLVERSSDVVYFTLRNCFAVTQVVDDVSGEQLAWWREGSRLAVYMPECYQKGDSFLVTIHYSGEVWEWSTGVSTRPNGLINVVDSDFSLLRSGYAWYPIVGDHPLYTRMNYAKSRRWFPEFTLWAQRASHSGIPFALTVDIDVDSTVVSNLEQMEAVALTGEYKRRYQFAALGGRDVFLMTGPYSYEKRKLPGREDFIAVYSYLQHGSKVDEMMAELREPYLFYEEMFKGQHPDNFSVTPKAKSCTIVEIPNLFVKGAEYNADITLVNTVLIDNFDFQSPLHRLGGILGGEEAKRQRFEAAILNYWGQDGMVHPYSNGNIVDGVGLYLHTLYKEKNGQPGYYKQVKQALQAGVGEEGEELPKGIVVQEVFMILDAIGTLESGPSVIKKIMGELYPRYVAHNKITPEDFSKIVNISLADMNCPPEKLAEIYGRLGKVDQASKEIGENKIERWISIFFQPFY